MREARSKFSAYGVCVQDDAILLARYMVASTGERWRTLPGGKLEHGVDPVDALCREFEEETGYKVEVGSLLGVGSRTHDVDWGITGGAELHSIGVYYDVQVESGDLRSEVHGSTDLAAWVPWGTCRPSNGP